MNLRKQLLLVSILTLILPWAGCQFIRETESALREGQQQMLSGTARAIADSLSHLSDEMLGDDSLDVRGATRLYGQPLQSAPLVDGYLDDWHMQDGEPATIRGTEGPTSFVLGTHGQYVFLHVDVRDTSPVYTQLPVENSPGFADEIVVVSANQFGTQTRFRFRAGAPGPIVAVRDTGTELVAETRIEASWADSTNGYRLEARFPRNMIGDKLGIAVTNTTNERDPGIRSATFSGDSPGKFITVSPLLQSVAMGHVQPGLRLTITDKLGWRRALAGNISTTPSTTASGSGNAWLRLIYSVLLEPGDESALASPDPSGREQSSYIANALRGEPTPRWFRSAETGRAVVSVAYPVWSGSVQTGAIVLQQGTDAILSLTNKALTRLISLTLISTVVVALVLLGYATWLSSRIRRLSSAADRALDEKQVRATLPSALAGDEIGDLSRSFSSVLKQLGSYNNYLQTLASKLSHELRTPLTIVRSSLENLEHESLSDDAKAYTSRAKGGVERLGSILNAMSEASRTEELIENVEAEVFDIDRVLESTVEAYKDAWPERQFRLDNQSSGRKLNGSPELIIQMLDKLVDNAVGFSKASDVIDISSLTRDGHAVLRVSNPGPPLPDDMQTQMFNSMVSVRDGDSGQHLGLGLHIARLIAEGHNGSITAKNTGNGVTFEIRLPLAESNSN